MGSLRRSADGCMMEIHELPTPCYVVDEKKLEENLKIFKGHRTGNRL